MLMFAERNSNFNQFPFRRFLFSAIYGKFERTHTPTKENVEELELFVELSWRKNFPTTNFTNASQQFLIKRQLLLHFFAFLFYFHVLCEDKHQKLYLHRTYFYIRSFFLLFARSILWFGERILSFGTSASKFLVSDDKRATPKQNY